MLLASVIPKLIYYLMSIIGNKERIDRDAWRISSDMRMQLWEELKTNKTLLHLRLDLFNIQEVEMSLIAEALKANSTLISLTLCGFDNIVGARLIFDQHYTYYL